MQRDSRCGLHYPWGDSLPAVDGTGNFADDSTEGLLKRSLSGYNDSYPATAPVESFKPNALGLFNVGGNVAEWVQDIYSIHPSGSSKVLKDPLGPTEGDLCVICLGTGTTAAALARGAKERKLHIVEISRAVWQLSSQFEESYDAWRTAPGHKSHLEDGRQFLEQGGNHLFSHLQPYRQRRPQVGATGRR